MNSWWWPNRKNRAGERRTARPRVTGLLAAVLAATVSSVTETQARSPSNSCEEAIERVERLVGIPSGLLLAVGRVESGLSTGGEPRVWAWTINAAGRPMRFGSRRMAVQTVRRLLAGGVRSIDVGCVQINLKHHPDAFATLDDAFDPDLNAAYGARFLLSLYASTGSWDEAVGRYHAGSAGPEHRKRGYACSVYKHFVRVRRDAAPHAPGC